jgi:hypothetical protein
MQKYHRSSLTQCLDVDYHAITYDVAKLKTTVLASHAYTRPHLIKTWRLKFTNVDVSPAHKPVDKWGVENRTKQSTLHSSSIKPSRTTTTKPSH